MPVQYSGLTDEHLTVRSAVGLFDVSHMGELTVTGKDAFAFLQSVTTNDLTALAPGKAQYNLLLNENGGVVDDIIVYQLAPENYFICVNASNTDKDFAWLTKHNSTGAKIENVSAAWGQIAVQGPNAQMLVEQLFGETPGAFSSVAGFTFFEKPVPALKAACIAARTGYTGEDGFEIFCPSEHVSALWDLAMELGQPLGVKPAGLGARDTLRLEVCYPLHGHEITDDLTPLSSGLGWVVKLQKGDFIGKSSLERQQNTGIDPVLVGLEVTGAGIVREGTPLYLPGQSGGERIGWVTSGTKPPTVNKAIGLAFVPAVSSAIGTVFDAEVRDRRFPVKVIKRPFFRGPLKK